MRQGRSTALEDKKHSFYGHLGAAEREISVLKVAKSFFIVTELIKMCNKTKTSSAKKIYAEHKEVHVR